jgi:hypothetical protein
MSEERFYNQVREQLFDYSPEVPQSVYGGMRRKLWWSDFTSFKAFRFNMWYLLIMVGGASAAVIYSTKENTDSIATKAGTFESRSWEPTLANATAGGESATTSCCASHEQTGTCAPKMASCTASKSGSKTKTTRSAINEITSTTEVQITEPTVLIQPDVIMPELENLEVSAQNDNEVVAPLTKEKASTRPMVLKEYFDSKLKSGKKR